MTPGEPIADLTFRTPDDAPVRLSSFLASEHLLVVFLRHLA